MRRINARLRAPLRALSSLCACAALAVAAEASRTVFEDGFEKPSIWELRHRGLRSSLERTNELAKVGKWALFAHSDRFEVTCERAGLSVRESSSELSFYYYAAYGESPPAHLVLKVSVTSVTAACDYTGLVPGPPCGQWTRVVLRLTDLSPSLEGEVIGAVRFSLLGRAEPLTLGLDEVRIRNDVPPLRSVRPWGRARPGPTAETFRHPLRAVSLSSSLDSEACDALARAGLNALLVSADNPVALESASAQCLRERWTLLVSFPLFAPRGADSIGRKAAFADGLTGECVCPLDRSHWVDRVTLKLIELLATLAPLRSVVVLFDARAEDSTPRDYYTVDCCFCPDCFRCYLTRAKRKERPLLDSPAGRLAWLAEHKVLPEYFDCLEEEASRLAKELCAKLVAANPVVQLGIIGYRDFWVTRGVLRGLGAAGAVPLVLSDGSALSAAPFSVDCLCALLAERQQPFLYLPGLSAGGVEPATLLGLLTVYQHRGAGYWISGAPKPKTGSSVSEDRAEGLLGMTLVAVSEANRRFDLLKARGKR